MENSANNLEGKPASALWVTLKIFSAFFVITFFIFSGIVFNNNRNRDRLAGEQYINIEDGFIITYPKSWKIERSDMSPIKSKNQTVISFTNPVGDIADKFLGSASLAVFFDYADGPTNLDVYKNIIKSDMSHSFDNFTVLKEEKISVDNLEGYLISASDNGDKANNFSPEKPSYRSLLFITTEEKSNREFFIWATAFESSWPKYEKLFENCIKSFKIPQ